MKLGDRNSFIQSVFMKQSDRNSFGQAIFMKQSFMGTRHFCVTKNESTFILSTFIK